MLRDVYGLLSKRVEAHGDRPLLQTPDGTWSYREVAAAADEHASGLASLDLTRDDVVSIAMNNRPEFVFLLLGAAKLGIPVAPINTGMRGEGIEHLVERAGIDIVVSSDQVLEKMRTGFDGLDVTQYSVTEGTSQERFPTPGCADEIESAAVRVTDLAVLLHTSGTTGKPKWCELSHAYLTRLGSVVADAFDLSPTDTAFTPLPLYHINPLGYGFFGATTAGATLATVDSFSVSHFWDQVRGFDASVVVLHMAPRNMIAAETSAADATGHDIRVMFPADREFLRTYEIPKMVTGYGSTEAGGLTHVHTFTHVPDEVPAEEALSQVAGRRRHDVEIRIVDDNGSQVDAGQRGEILVRPTEPGAIFDGYYGDSTATVQAWDGLWYNTGDLGYHDDEGILHFVGRRGDTISHKGEFVNVDLVESALEALESVDSAVVVGVPDEIVGHRVVSHLVGDDVDPRTVADAVAAELPNHMLPEYIAIVDEYPRIEGTEKVDRNSLRERGVVDAVYVGSGVDPLA